MNEKEVKTNGLDVNRDNVDQESKDEPKKEERLFTQEELNEIIRRRLQDRKKEQARIERDEAEYQRREQELAEREDALNKREELYNRTEFLRKRHYPEELLELVKLEEGEDFEDKVIAIVSAVDRTRDRRQSFDYIPNDSGSYDVFPEANYKHEPRISGIR